MEPCPFDDADSSDDEPVTVPPLSLSASKPAAPEAPVSAQRKARMFWEDIQIKCTVVGRAHSERAGIYVEVNELSAADLRTLFQSNLKEV